MDSFPIAKSPLLLGYSEQQRDTRLFTNVASGNKKVRNTTTVAKIPVTEVYILSDQEKEAVDSFWRVTLGRGTKPFTKQHPSKKVSKVYNFVESGAPSYQAVSSDKWQVTLPLEYLD